MIEPAKLAVLWCRKDLAQSGLNFSLDRHASSAADRDSYLSGVGPRLQGSSTHGEMWRRLRHDVESSGEQPCRG